MREGPQRLPKGVDFVPVGYSSPESHPPNPNPSAIETSVWWQAELAALGIIRRIHPTLASELRRNNVVESLHKLIGIDVGFPSYLGLALFCFALFVATFVVIFPFGSFPLRTYLPNGDIDLTAIGFPSSEEALSYDVLAVLEREEHNKDSEFELKNVRHINAEVKLVKCLVQNISIDISFNQIGGLSTLCFFEQVDRFIGKDHLFKRSILLIKAWCYYESHILGSQYGLLSTYAMETLILYIFHLFHSSLDGPLAVLYRFLYYYSKFDWEKYCISLHGPLSLSSLTPLSVETFDNDGGDLLLTEEFLRSCVDSFSVPVQGSEGNSRPFTRKHLNIVDPLRANNNLGRSVSLGGFFRIRSALAYGARKLGHLLLLPACSIRDEINMFFMSTLDKNGGGERPDVQDLFSRSPCYALAESMGVELAQPVEKLEKENADELSSESPTSKGYRDLNKELKNVRISDLDECEGMVAPQKTLSYKQQNSPTSDAKDLVTSRTPVLRSMTESSQTASSIEEDSILDFRHSYHAPHLFFNPESQTRKDIKLDQVNSTTLDPTFNVPSTIISTQPDSFEMDSSLSNTGWVGNFGEDHPSERLNLVDYGLEGNLGNRINEPFAVLDEMLDLSGDFDKHLDNLNYAVWYQEKMTNTRFLPMYQSPPYSYYSHGKDVWTDGSQFTVPLSPRPLLFPAAYYTMNLPVIPSTYNIDDARRRRGTGTFLPKVDYQKYRERLFAKHPERLDIPQSSAPHASSASPNASGTESSILQFGSFGPVSVETPTKEHGRKSDSPISDSRGSGFTSPASSSRRPALSSDRGRASEEPYQLKDEDFPPLSG
ncbi:hypothetical protein IEQ34_008566 [Dendrobium chrysotoxum]|uniref:PAP/OAS1 substrate-binding-related domain-containing protein n=1 Tax=Dendrobium chrysotoxum TaxID=161865 RepID=A0AAV7GWC3_DENCH|nr:hypothetical protein IEQ34_008566 [Dendrobium chrysotoxum]